MDIIDILTDAAYHDPMTEFQEDIYYPEVNSIANDDEVGLLVQNQDLYVLSCGSAIYVAEKFELTTAAGDNTIQFTNSFPVFLFDEIIYELNGAQIDQSEYVGMTSIV